MSNPAPKDRHEPILSRIRHPPLGRALTTSIGIKWATCLLRQAARRCYRPRDTRERTPSHEGVAEGATPGIAQAEGPRVQDKSGERYERAAFAYPPKGHTVTNPVYKLGRNNDG
jgi:hypothetical protein